MNSRNPPSKLEYVGEIIEPQCPYRYDTEVCKFYEGREQDIPDGYKIMSEQDVRNVWSACSYVITA